MPIGTCPFLIAAKSSCIVRIDDFKETSPVAVGAGTVGLENGGVTGSGDAVDEGLNSGTDGDCWAGALAGAGIGGLIGDAGVTLGGVGLGRGFGIVCTLGTEKESIRKGGGGGLDWGGLIVGGEIGEVERVEGRPVGFGWLVGARGRFDGTEDEEVGLVSSIEINLLELYTLVIYVSPSTEVLTRVSLLD